MDQPERIAMNCVGNYPKPSLDTAAACRNRAFVKERERAIAGVSLREMPRLILRYTRA